MQLKILAIVVAAATANASLAPAVSFDSPEEGLALIEGDALPVNVP
jgi:hypothetical protein